MPIHGTCKKCGGETMDYCCPGCDSEEIAVLRNELEVLRDAVREHRDQRGDDRCWLDDEKLYAALPEGYTPPTRSETVELSLCQRYIASRHHPCTEYVSPQRRIEELEKELADLRAVISKLPVVVQDDITDFLSELHNTTPGTTPTEQ
jgi:hypothetical protein